MKPLSKIFLAGLVMISLAFAPVADQPLYPELAQTFKLLRKNFSSISYDRRDVLTGIQQVVGIMHSQKKPIVVELIGTDGSTAPVAKAFLESSLITSGLTDIKINIVGAVPTEKISTTLNKLGFKAGNDGGLNVKYNDQATPISFASATSDPSSVHILLNDGSESLLSVADKLATKLKYPSTGELNDEQAKLIATEMLYVAMRIKESWKSN